MARTESILKRHPAAINERNHFGHNPFHLAIANPACLQILTRVADRGALNEGDNDAFLPVEAALWWSGRTCKLKPFDRRHNLGGPYYRGKTCHRCHCAQSLVILLKADCGTPTQGHWRGGLQRLLKNCSQRGKRRFIRAIKNRRERLKELALRNLPATDANRLGLRRDTVLDLHAMETFRLLEDRGVHIPVALSIIHPRAAQDHDDHQFGAAYIYKIISNIDDAQLFFQCGFRDTNIWAAIRGWDDLPDQDLPDLRWLHSHGADSLFRIHSFKNDRTLTSAHAMFWLIGCEMRQREIREPRLGPKLQCEDLEWAQQLQLSDIADNCQCRCVAGGCTPLTYLLKWLRLPRLFDRYNYTSDVFPDKIATMMDQLLGIFGARFERRHLTAFLRFATHTMLDLPHTCCDPHNRFCFYFQFYQRSAEEVGEIHQEHMNEFRLLEELLMDFEKDFETILSGPGRRNALVSYMRTAWAERVKEVRTRLDDDKLSEEERKRAEAIGVVWGPPQAPPPQKPRRSPTLPPYRDPLRQAIIKHMETGCLEYDSWCPK